MLGILCPGQRSRKADCVPLNQNSCIILFQLAIVVPEKKKKIPEAKLL